jgi:hypothetical protein
VELLVGFPRAYNCRDEKPPSVNDIFKHKLEMEDCRRDFNVAPCIVLSDRMSQLKGFPPR